MSKVLSINRFTGIDQRSSVGTPAHPLVNQPAAPTIAELHKIFLSDGVPLAVAASRKALEEARLDATELTHMVSTTCTDSANPGYDHHVAQALGLIAPGRRGPERVLLHGVGCSGGLAALRTAANLCLGHAMRGLPARALVLALEVSTTMVRSELDSINALQETRIGVALFSDCSSAVVLSNGISSVGAPPSPPPLYDLLGWEHAILPDTEGDLGFDVDPCGWKVVLSPRVPQLAQSAIRPSYDALLDSLPPPPLGPPRDNLPSDFDWAMHPGGATILTGAEKAMGITPEHMRASYDTYMRHGNSSSATIFGVLDRLRSKEMDALAPGGSGPKEHVVGCAFGPGIAVEMCMLRRGAGAGRRGIPGMQTPPETESEVSSRSGDADEDVEAVPAVVAPPAATETETTKEPVQRADWSTPTDGDAFISEALADVELD